MDNIKKNNSFSLGFVSLKEDPECFLTLQLFLLCLMHIVSSVALRLMYAHLCVKQTHTLIVLLSHACLYIPYEQLCDTFFNGTVGVRSLADVFDGIDGFFKLTATTRVHFPQDFHHFDFIAVVQCSRIPRYIAVTWLATDLK